MSSNTPIVPSSTPFTSVSWKPFLIGGAVLWLLAAGGLGIWEYNRPEPQLKNFLLAIAVVAVLAGVGILIAHDKAECMKNPTWCAEKTLLEEKRRLAEADISRRDRYRYSY